MAPFIFKKRNKNGRVYYWVGENKRVNGKTKRAWELYLGSADKIAERFLKMDAEPEPLATLEFGGITALLALEKKLDLINIINSKINKSVKVGHLSTGEYLFFAIINRCLDPCSRNQLGKWCVGTSLTRFFPIRKKKLTSQHFWYHMDLLSEAGIYAISEEICRKILTEFNLNLLYLLYDPTNFCTYIAGHPGNQLPRHGRAKKGKKSLRQINYALLAPLDFAVPLFHYTYPGNMNDAESFKEILPKMVAYLDNIVPKSEEKDITIILDKGNNSLQIFKELDESPYHFIGSLRPSSFKDLIDIPLTEFAEEFTDCYGKQIKAKRLNLEVYETQRTVILVFNQSLKARQVRTLEKNIEKRIEALIEFQQEKLNVKKWRKKEACHKKLASIVDKKKLKPIIHYQLAGEDGSLRLTFEIDQTALELEKERLGKMILFTDRADWSTQTIEEGYKGKWLIEDDFRCLKNPYMISEMPMYCWTDQKIRVHIFICILALTFLRLLQRTLFQAGIKLSLKETLTELKGMKEVLFKLPFKNKIVRKLIKLNKTQQKLQEVLDLDKYL